MTTELEYVSRDETLATAAERMFRNGISHVIVREGNQPTAVITHRTALLAAYRADEALSDVSLTRFGRGFERTSSPDRTVLLSVGHLRRSKTGCLPVVDGMEVVGVLTREDVLSNVANITSETLRADKAGHEWSRGESDNR